MKNTITSTAKIIVLLTLITLMGSSFTLHKKSGSDENMEDVCLEITGKVGFEGYTNDPSYKVELIHYNTVIKTDTVKARAAIFSFLLKKDSYYTIRISKKGYAPKLVSICTILDENAEEDFFSQFHFTTNLIPESKAASLDKDALEFPIALVTYDKAKKVFYDNKKYTANIKKVLYSAPNKQL